MIINARNSRRRFLTKLLWLGVLMLSRPGVALATVGPRRQDPSIAKLLKLLRHEKSAIIIGREYLRVVPKEMHAQILLDLISSDWGQKGIRDAGGKGLRESLRLRIHRDFEEEHTVRIHGWLLSVTEARLCALAALVSQPGIGGHF